MSGACEYQGIAVVALMHSDDVTFDAPSESILDRCRNRTNTTRFIHSPSRCFQLVHKFLLETRRRRSNMLLHVSLALNQKTIFE